MAQQTAAPAQGTTYMQGIAVPASSVNPQQFFARTRRNIVQEKVWAYDSTKTQDVVELRKSGIISTILVKFSGSLVVTPGTGTVSSTAHWPYNLARFRYTANGASNLIDADGLSLKAREFMKKGDLSDNGLDGTVLGNAVTAGTLRLASETWGVGSGQASIAGGTYPVELLFTVPVAEDEVDLNGATFLATSTADITLTLNYRNLSQLFTLTGNGAVSLTGTWSVHPTKFSIPIGADGNIVVPDLSNFHTVIQSATSAIQNGDNETRLVGQGGSKSLLRVFYQLWNGASNAASPLVANATNFGAQAWRYGTSESPDTFADGQIMRYVNTRQFGTDIGAWGFLAHDFASELEFRDVVDMGTTGDLRIATNVPSGVSLASPSLVYTVETVFKAGQAA